MILFVDDEERPINTFMDELRLAGHDVHLESTAEGALRYFRDNLPQIQLVVLDIMMPYGEMFTATETEDGLRTGIHVFKKLREESWQVPVIIFTNATAQPVEEAFAEQPQCSFLKKIDCFPFEFREEVANMLLVG